MAIRLWNRLKICFFLFLACFRTYLGQPDNHIGWATSMPFSTTFSRGSILESLVKTIYYSKFQIHFTSPQWNSGMDGTQIWLLPNPGLQPKKHTCVKVCNTLNCKHPWSYFELFGSFFILWDSKVSSFIFFSVATLGGSSSQSSLRQTCESPTSFISCYSCSTAPAIP